jgi:hypothetical protein
MDIGLSGGLGAGKKDRTAIVRCRERTVSPNESRGAGHQGCKSAMSPRVRVAGTATGQQAPIHLKLMTTLPPERCESVLQGYHALPPENFEASSCPLSQIKLDIR